MHLKTIQIFSLNSHKLDLEEKKSIIRESLSFFFVRHPFERLVSAYRNKVLEYNFQNWRGRTPKNFTREPKEDRQVNSSLVRNWALVKENNDRHGNQTYYAQWCGPFIMALWAQKEPLAEVEFIIKAFEQAHKGQIFKFKRGYQ